MIFLLPSGLMRHFNTIVGIDRIDMFNGRHDFPVRGIIACEFVGDEPAWFIALALDQATEEAHGRVFVAAALHENINRVTILIDGSPQVLVFSLNRDKDLIKMPHITQTSLSLFQFLCIGWSKLLTPLTDRFICDGDSTLGK